MPRIIVLALLLAGLASLAIGLARSVRERRAADASGPHAETRPMQRTAFLLLVALIFYAALWGG